MVKITDSVTTLFPQGWTHVFPSRSSVSLSRRVFPTVCFFLLLAYCKSFSEHNGCFVKPWRLNNRQLSRLIRLLGLYCHQSRAYKWSEQACCCPCSTTLKGIITTALFNSASKTYRDMEQTHLHIFEHFFPRWQISSSHHNPLQGFTSHLSAGLANVSLSLLWPL